MSEGMIALVSIAIGTGVGWAVTMCVMWVLIEVVGLW